MGCHSASEGASLVPNDMSVIPNSRSFKDSEDALVARVAARAPRDTRLMLTREDIEEIAGALPETAVEHSPDGRPSFRVRNRWFLAHREPRPDAVDVAKA